jgi:transcription elongation factor GreA
MKLQTEIAQTVSIGSTVHIRDLELNEREMYTLTRPSEADIRLNRISTLSPIGRAIYGRRPGEIVEVEAPGGVFHVEIEAVEQLPDLQYARAG